MAKFKVKVPDGAVAGAEIEVEIDAVPQEKVNEIVQREKGQAADKLKAIEADKKKIEDELTALRGSTSSTDAERIDKLEKELAENKAEKARLEIKGKVNEAFEARVPKAYRDQVKLEPGATEEEIKAAVEKTTKAWAEDMKALGVDITKLPTREEVKPIGNLGNGGAPVQAGQEALEALALARQIKFQGLEYIKGKSEDEQAKAALAWKKKGLLIAKAAA